MAFLMYGWDRNWRDYQAQGLGGRPMDHAASDGFTRHHLAIGDVVYVVAQLHRRMLLIGRLPVDEIVSRAEAEHLLQRSVVDKREHVLAHLPTSIVRFDREVPEGVARRLRTVRGARVAFASEAEYVLKNTALQPTVWLDAASANALDALLADDLPGHILEDPVFGPDAGPVSAAMRRAVELRAMEVAAAQFRNDGWEVVDVSIDHPYDLHCRQGGEYLCVEVKGSTGPADRVVLTANEVGNAQTEHPRTALAIVRHIELELSRPEPVATGGELALYLPWSPEGEGLVPSAFYYTPPARA